MFQDVELKLQDVVHMFQDVELMFQDVEHKIYGQKKRFWTGKRPKSIFTIFYYFSLKFVIDFAVSKIRCNFAPNLRQK
jgi:hypothetical protein